MFSQHAEQTAAGHLPHNDEEAPAKLEQVHAKMFGDAHIAAAAGASIRSRKIPNYKFNLTVGKLSPVLNDGQSAVLGRLVNNFANSASGSLKRQPEDLLISHSGCQFPRVRVHAGTPTLTDGSHIRPQDLEIAMRAYICPRCSQPGVAQLQACSATVGAGFHPVLFRVGTNAFCSSWL
jgi:hypothetical protein